MDNNIVNDYTWNILKKQLQRYKVTGKILYDVIDDVKTKLNSLIYNWNDLEFRNAILILGSEEGCFYEPYNEVIGNMVVVTIRNSLIEGIASKDYKYYGANKILEDYQIKEITSEAINYFSKFNIGDYSNTIECDYDFYREIANKYPVALKSLIELAKCSINNREHDYVKVEYNNPYELEELDNIKPNKINCKNIENGIELSFNESLCNLLSGIKNKQSRFFITDSFKMVTRNFEKIMMILEFILTHDGFFITCNYLISNNSVSRRRDLLRAGHGYNERDLFSKFNTLDEVSDNRKELLEEVLDLIRIN